jgi:hypothetical protein
VVHEPQFPYWEAPRVAYHVTVLPEVKLASCCQPSEAIVFASASTDCSSKTVPSPK